MKHAFGVRFVTSLLRDDSAQIQLTLTHAVSIKSSPPWPEHQGGLTESNLLESLQITQDRTVHSLCVTGILKFQGLLLWPISRDHKSIRNLDEK